MQFRLEGRIPGWQSIKDSNGRTQAMNWIINNRTLPPQELIYYKSFLHQKDWNIDKDNDGRNCSMLWIQYVNTVPPEELQYIRFDATTQKFTNDSNSMLTSTDISVDEQLSIEETTKQEDTIMDKFTSWLYDTDNEGNNCAALWRKYVNNSPPQDII